MGLLLKNIPCLSRNPVGYLIETESDLGPDGSGLRRRQLMMCEKIIRICDECASEWKCDCQTSWSMMGANGLYRVFHDVKRVKVCADCCLAEDACNCIECETAYHESLREA